MTTYGYDAVGNLTAKQNPRGKTTTYSYDNLSRLAGESDPLSHTRSYAYDAAGRLTSRADAKSQTISYTYNDRNELTNVTYPDLSYVSFSYNDAGARTQMIDATGTTSYSYDSLYRLTSVTFPGSRTVAYGYDDASRRTSVTYPGGTNQATYAYDAANRLSTVTDWHSNVISYAYDDANRMTSTTLPSSTGVVSTYSYDNSDRLTGISHVKGGTTLASVAYTLDAVGNRTQRVDQQGTHSYSYDDLYRLTSVTYPGPTTTTYSYDAFGNRTQLVDGSGTTSYAYDDADRLTTVTPPSPAPAVSYSWDNNGDLTARGSDSFSWDYEDRMLSATVGGTTTTFAYRGDGLRDSRTTGGVTTTFTWDVAAGLPVVLDDGAQYVYGLGLVAQVSGSNTYYYLADGLGSTMATIDSSGAVVNSYTYDVYGQVTTSSGGQANEFQFAGQQTDPTGLQYLRARYYDPTTGRFLSRDPLASAPWWAGNSFSYASSNPALFIDPRGLKEWDGCSPDCVPSGEPEPPEPLSEDPDSGFGTCYGRPITTAPCLGPTKKDMEWAKDFIDGQLAELALLIGEYVVASPHGTGPKELTGYTDHGLEQAILRDGHGVSTRAIRDAVKTGTVTEEVDVLGRHSWRYEGRDAVVYLSKAGKVITTWAKSSRGWRY